MPPGRLPSHRENPGEDPGHAGSEADREGPKPQATSSHHREQNRDSPPQERQCVLTDRGSGWSQPENKYFRIRKPTRATPAQYFSKDLKDTLESIADELKLTQPEIGTNPLFGSVVSSINNSCQRQTEMQLMNATLDVYMQIFGNIFQHIHHNHQDRSQNAGVLDHLSTTKRSEVISTLKWLRREMEELKSHMSCQNHKSPEDVYNMLNRIKVDDPVVQRKALAEFLEVYQAASVITCNRC
ncbi:uncharacterized protein LOC121635099 [Melanotaenia boesemani]|uniref:uncharacterized protein LOC121635099 n=1 Tax=Melanotaenia boesemani TaxID=1250792 RepID=UPI001C03FD90|nr:uncharacterized protein LOC121635099 [Melanotaenia boesemani]